jgi:hypothetical protein
LFAFPDPERDCARRRECLSGAAGARIDELDRGLGSDVWRLLADYVELHRSAFDNRQ